MKLYLKIINPILSVIVFLLCIYAAVVGDGKFDPGRVRQGDLSTYFVAKGIFCAATLFIVGRILLILIENVGNRKSNQRE
ncbi:MAG: hypothetical protein NC825_05535 [Candidatus Omnitrophica bacterium]|jgi:hypothetical protein|nr:hypothetical protein [Candidatus Omnitrophota bacterium]